jgi:hypothetical protein
MDFAGGIWAFWDILVPSTALSIQEFKKGSEEAQGTACAGLTRITAPLFK